MILRRSYCCSVAARLCPTRALAAARNSRTAPALLLLYTRPNSDSHERQQRRTSSTPARRAVAAPPSSTRTPQKLMRRCPPSTRRVVRFFTSSRHVSSKVGLPTAAAAINPATARGEERGDGGRRFGAEPEEGGEGGLSKRLQGERGDLKGVKQRVVVGMSGGVDSSVVAMLLHQQASEAWSSYCNCLHNTEPTTQSSWTF